MSRGHEVSVRARRQGDTEGLSGDPPSLHLPPDLHICHHKTALGSGPELGAHSQAEYLGQDLPQGVQGGVGWEMLPVLSPGRLPQGG